MQEFRVKVDRKRRYEEDRAQSGGSNTRNDNSIEQSFEMPGDLDIISRVIPEEERSEEHFGAMSKNWETGIQVQRIYSEMNIRCFMCGKVIQEEIGVHMALTHCRTAVGNWNKPIHTGNERWRCKNCNEDVTSMSVDNYLIHSTFAHDALEKLSIEHNLKLVEEIRKALKERSENEEREAQSEHRNRNRGVKRQRSTSRSTEALSEPNHSSSEKSQDEKKMAQKLNSYTPLTTKEVQVLRRDIPLRKSTLEEKDELRNAAKKVLTKLHLVYTMGLTAVPKKYVCTRNSMTTNFNHLYDENNSEREENMRRE